MSPALFGESAAHLCAAVSRLLGWRPDQFWNSTPAELGSALRLPTGNAPDAVVIEELRQRFPDE